MNKAQNKNLDNILDVALGDTSLKDIDMGVKENISTLEDGIKKLIKDPLSLEYGVKNVYNKDYFVPLANKIIKKNDSSKGFSVIFGDVDYLKYTIDTYGHNKGDMLLQTVTKTLSEVAKEYNFEVLISRKADELLLLLPTTKRRIVDSYIVKTKKSFDLYRPQSFEKDIPVSVTFGYTIGDNLEENINRADNIVNNKKLDLHKNKGYSR
jgi:two-component system, cell cycle response regulator